MTPEQAHGRRGERLALVVADTGDTLTHASLDDRTRRLVSSLTEAGLAPGSVVALVATPGLFAFEVYAAARRAGLAFAALDPTLGLAELAYVLNDSGAEALFLGEEMRVLGPMLAPLTPGVRLRVAAGGPLPLHVDHDTCLASAPTGAPTQLSSVHLHYSAGTLARPVATRLARSNVAGEQGSTPVAAALAAHHPLSGDTVLFSTTSLADPVAAQLYASVLLLGGTVVTATGTEAVTVLGALEQHRVTLAHLLPGVIEDLVRLPVTTREAVDLTALRAVVHSSAPCPVRAKRELIAWWGPVVHEFYGGSEFEVLTFIDAQDWLDHPGSVGRGLRGPAVARDAHGADLPAGEEGVVWFADDASGHWVTLGDVGRVDADGFVHLSLRADVEEAVRLHPGVADAAVVGHGPGARLTLVVQPRAGVAADHRLEEELMALLGASDQPVEVEFVGSLPRTGSGRLVRRRLRSAYDDPQVSGASWVPSARRPT